MESGWISIHRQIKDNWIWEDKPFSKGQAWIDLLLMANHTDRKIALGNELITVKRGSFITSELKLMDAWGWSKGKVRSFLKMLENDGMIERITDHKKTTINIVNYGIFQSMQTTERPQTNRKRTANEPQTDTNNNDNNYNNYNNYKPTAKKQKNKNSFFNYEQREWDFEKLDKLKRKEFERNFKKLDKLKRKEFERNFKKEEENNE